VIRHEHFQVTCAANVTPAAPVETLLSMTPGVPIMASVRIAPGHVGLTGFRLAFAHQQVIPWTAGAWVIGDSYTHTYDLDEYGDSGAWSLYCYNSDALAHLWLVEFKVRAFTRPSPARRVVLIDRDLIHRAAVRVTG
jgi:hypothetical protein